MPQEPAISMADVVFRFYEKGKRNILDHVSMEIAAGRLTVIMGSSGCGKSTLAAVCAGLYPEKSRQYSVRKISMTRFELQTGSVILRPGRNRNPPEGHLGPPSPVQVTLFG